MRVCPNRKQLLTEGLASHFYALYKTMTKHIRDIEYFKNTRTRFNLKCLRLEKIVN